MTNRRARAGIPRRWAQAFAVSLAGLLTATSCASSEQPAAPGPAPDAMDRRGPEAAATDWAQRTLEGLSLEQKVGQLFVTDVYGKSADEANPKNQEKFGVPTPAEVVRQYQVGGVIYFNNSGTDNVDDPAQLAGLSNGLQRTALDAPPNVPLMLSVDQEGGRVTRVGAPATEFPSGMALGAARNTADAKATARIGGDELRAMGITQDFAPDADVNSNPLNPVIGSRSFSARPDLTSQLVTAQVQGYQDSADPAKSVSAAAKHFPGHGDAAEDSHTGLPVITRNEQQWRETDLPPFQAAVDAGVDSIMTAHITFPNLDPSGDPATLSKPIITDRLRGELGYDGVVVTDSLQMAGVRKLYPDNEIPVRALEAGVDQLLRPANLRAAIDGVTDAVRSGRLTEQRIDQSVLRILKLKFKRGVVANPLAEPRTLPATVGTAEHHNTVAQATDKATTVLRNEANTLPIRNRPGKVLVTGWNNPKAPGYPAEPVQTLAREVAARGSAATALSTGDEPDQAQVDGAVAAAREADLTVVLTNDLRTDEAQRNLVTSLAHSGKPVVAVAVQEPYDAGYAPEVPSWLATYDWRDVSMSSLARVLFGEARPQGKLPVDIPSGDDPNQVVYPFGHGLSW